MTSSNQPVLNVFNQMFYRAAAICAAAMVSGCTTFAHFKDPERREQVTGIDKHSTYPVVRRSQFEDVNLLELIDPAQEAKAAYPIAWNELATRPAPQRIGGQYDLTFAWFNRTEKLSADEKRNVRNSVQERIMSVSISRCNVFKTYLRRQQTDVNFLMGSLTTVAGVLGGVLTGANASRNLAGTAGLFSGLKSEFNQSYFSNLAAQVIIKGIESRQTSTSETLRTHGKHLTVETYPLEAAVRDAIYFDGLCSTLVGLDEASEAIRLSINPGLESATRTMLNVRTMQAIQDGKREDFLKPEKIAEFRALIAPSPTPLAAAPMAQMSSIRSDINLSKVLELRVRDASSLVASEKQKIVDAMVKKFEAFKGSMAASDYEAQIKGKTTPADMGKLFEDVRGKFTTSYVTNLQKSVSKVASLSAALVAADLNLQIAATEKDRIDRLADKAIAISKAREFESELKKGAALYKLDLANATEKAVQAIGALALADVPLADDGKSFMTEATGK